MESKWIEYKNNNISNCEAGSKAYRELYRAFEAGYDSNDILINTWDDEINMDITIEMNYSIEIRKIKGAKSPIIIYPRVYGEDTKIGKVIHHNESIRWFAEPDVFTQYMLALTNMIEPMFKNRPATTQTLYEIYYALESKINKVQNRGVLF